MLRLKEIAVRVMKENPPLIVDKARALFYEAPTNTLVIINRLNSKQSTIMRPPGGAAYVDKFLRKPPHIE